jgi:KipI family sensor histidine kinase inhibitor
MDGFPRILPAGDQAVLVEFGGEIQSLLNRKVHAVARSLSARKFPGIGETISSYCSLLVYYDPFALSFAQVSSRIEEVLRQTVAPAEISQPVKEIPVLYGGEEGPDLPFVAEHNRLAVEEVVALHSRETYLVYVVGFAPGFAAMGTVPEKIRAPRLPSPRTRVPAGSVGIGGMQTGIYSVESPGGWQLIGRTPLKLFDLHRHPPSFFQAGDRARFYPIGENEFQEIANVQSPPPLRREG